MSGIVSAAITAYGAIFQGTGSGHVKSPPNGKEKDFPFPGSEKRKKPFDVERFKKAAKPVCKVSSIVFLCSVALATGLLIWNIPLKDEKAAFLWHLERAQDSGSLKIMSNLGECYFWGRGTDVDYDRAFSCFEKAAEGGYKSAQYHLAVCYARGLGTEIDDGKALAYFQQVEDNNADAQAYVGYYYYRGWGGLEADKEKALDLFSLSQGKGSVLPLYF